MSEAAELDLWCALGGREDGGCELRGLAEIAMVQAADFGKLHDLSCRGEFDRPEVGRVLVQQGGVMPLNPEVLREEIRKVYSQVVDDPKKGYHFQRSLVRSGGRITVRL